MVPYQFKDRITIIIPTRNEEQTISKIIEQSRPFGSQIIVIDGHSQDQTKEIAQKMDVEFIIDANKGKGEALRHCIPFIRNEITVFIDADGSHHAEDIPKIVEPIINGKADHVTGSRLIGGSSELHGGFDEFLRLTGSSFITACINWRFNVKLSDSQNGFRAIRSEVLRKLQLEEDITTIEQEMVIRTLKQGFKMYEIPAHEYRREFGKSNIQVSKVWPRYGWSLIKNLFFR